MDDIFISIQITKMGVLCKEVQECLIIQENNGSFLPWTQEVQEEAFAFLESGGVDSTNIQEGFEVYNVNRHGEFKDTEVEAMESVSIFEYAQSFWNATHENEDPYYSVSNVLHIWFKGELIPMLIGGFCPLSKKDKENGALVCWTKVIEKRELDL